MDIGVGDCVEAIRSMATLPGTVPGGGYYQIAQGARAVVTALTTRPGRCISCGERGPGFLLAEYPLIHHVGWCHCEWRRVGGDKDAHLRVFSEYLRERDAETIKNLTENLP